MKNAPTFSTELQQRLAAEVRAGLSDTGQTQHDISRATGITEPHISLMLSGRRTGSVTAWHALIAAAALPKR